MELYDEILLKFLKEEGLARSFDPETLIRDKAYDALSKIKRVVEDDTLDDKECFWRIEEIVRIFEEMGSQIESRHDFG